jgi:hypothetical protein
MGLQKVVHAAPKIASIEFIVCGMKTKVAYFPIILTFVLIEIASFGERK